MWRCVAAVLLCVAGCSEGRLVMQLSLPTDRTLDPTVECTSSSACSPNPRLARYSLRVSSPGTAPQNQERFASASGELTIGRVPVDVDVDIRLAGQTGTGQVLGVGAVRDVRVSSTGDTLVSLKFRKPMAYVAGGPTLRVLDTSASRGAELPALPLRGVLDVAAAPNGVIIAALRARSLVRIKTSSHQSVGCNGGLGACAETIQLKQDGPAASCVAITPDSRTALICLGQGMGSVINLADDKPLATIPFNLGDRGVTTRVAFEPDSRAGWVLAGGVDRTCSSTKASSLVRVLIDDTGAKVDQSRVPINLPGPAADVEVDPLDPRTLLVTLPCGNGSKIISLRDGKQNGQLSIAPAYDIAVTGSKIVVVGQAPRGPDPAGGLLPLHGEAIIIERSDAGRPPLPDPRQVAALTRRFEIPAISVRFRTSSSDQGFLFWSLDAQRVKFYDVEVSPDGQRALLLTETAYKSQLNFSSCTYDAELTATGFLLVDLNAGTVLHEALTSFDFARCNAPCIQSSGQPLNTKARCEAFFRDGLRVRGRLALDRYVPRRGALLFGGH